MNAIKWLLSKANNSSNGEKVFNATVPARMVYEITDFVRSLPEDQRVIEQGKGKVYLNWTDGKLWYELSKVTGQHNKAKYQRGRTHIRFISGAM
jgi:hypothetical protein